MIDYDYVDALGEDVAAFADQHPPPDDQRDVDMRLFALAGLEAAMADVRDRAAALRDPIDEWERDAYDRLNSRAEYLRSAIADWFIATGAKAIDSPHGKVTSRKGSVSLRVADNDEAVAAVEALWPDAIAKTIRVADVKARVVVADAEFEQWRDQMRLPEPVSTHAVDPETGEVIDGLAFVTSGRTVSVVTK